MFPHARNSLRRWSASEQGNKKIPIPIAVSLHNVMSITTAASTAVQESKTFRPNHEIKLLPSLKLEVIVNDQVTDDQEEEEEDGLAVLAGESSNRVVYSSPTPVQMVEPAWEHLDEHIDLPGEWWLKDAVYKTMRLRITQTLSEPRGDSSLQASNAASSVFLDIPLHPTKLERLHRDNVPETLPPNACLVYFSDGSTRCTPSLFSLLLKCNLTEPSPVEDFSRFADDVFRTLDHVPQTPDKRLRSESISALLEPQDLNNRLIDEFDGPNEPSENLINPADVEFAESEGVVTEQDAKKDRERLLALIAREEARLANDKLQLNEEREELLSLVQEAKEIQQHMEVMKRENQNQSAAFRHYLFRKEAQQMKLLRELNMVYPITLDPKKGYLIRDLRLPVDIYTTTVPEEEISAALGFCCHLVFMTSKYLTVSLRYRLFCSSSRSAIQMDANTFLPLFTARSVEREHLERGMELLGANVDCILMNLGVDFTPKSHILSRLKRIFDHVVEGEIPLHDNGIH